MSQKANIACFGLQNEEEEKKRNLCSSVLYSESENSKMEDPKEKRAPIFKFKPQN